MANGRALRSEHLQSGAAALGVAPDALALAAAMALPCAPMVLSGAATEEHARANARAGEALGVLRDAGPGELRALLESCRVEPEVYWAERSALQWN